jgi:hypothetical protein
MLGPIAGSVKGTARADVADRAAWGGEACQAPQERPARPERFGNQLAARSVQKVASTRVTNAAGADPLDR